MQLVMAAFFYFRTVNLKSIELLNSEFYLNDDWISFKVKRQMIAWS